MPPTLSVILPAWNEVRRIGSAVATVHAWLGAAEIVGEVLVVDDGSTDGTAEVARAKGAMTLVHPANRGKGAAVRTGMLAATGSERLFCDVDLATPLDEIHALRAALHAGADIAIASRRVDGAAPAIRSVRRRISSRAFNTITRRLLPEQTDTQCGFKLFSSAAAGAVFAPARIHRYAFDVETLVLARRAALRVQEVQVRWVESDSSRVRVATDGARMLADVLRIAWWDRLGGYP